MRWSICSKCIYLITLPETKTFLSLNMDGLKTSFLLGWPIFRGHVSFRECVYIYIYTVHIISRNSRQAQMEH